MNTQIQNATDLATQIHKLIADYESANRAQVLKLELSRVDTSNFAENLSILDGVSLESFQAIDGAEVTIRATSDAA